MSFLSRLISLVRLATRANRFETLFTMSERELTRLGFDRDRLVRGYIADLGAH